MEIAEKYLPVGTVVMLKGGTKRVVITGFCSTPNDDLENIFDYSGCLYPEGYLSSDQVCLFNHDQIETLYHMGLVDEEEKTFKEALVRYLSTRDEQPPMPTEVPPAPAPVEPVFEVETPAPVVEIEAPPITEPVVETPVVEAPIE